MKRFFHKISHVSVYIPLLIFLGSLFAVYMSIKITVTEPESAFNSGKAPMYFVIALFAFSAIYLLALTIRNYKKAGEQQEEDGRLIYKDANSFYEELPQKDANSFVVLPIAVTFTLFGCLFLMGGYLNRNSRDFSPVFFYIMGITFLAVGVFMLIKFIKALKKR